MARARVPAALLKRLDALDSGDGELKRPGVLLVPPILGYDEFDALAVPMQAKAFEAAREDTEDRAAVRCVERRTLPPTQ